MKRFVVSMAAVSLIMTIGGVMITVHNELFELVGAALILGAGMYGLRVTFVAARIFT